MIQQGDTVIFRGGANPEQVRWAGTNYPANLVVGKTYVVESVKYFGTHSQVWLAGEPGKYSSVHFTIA